MSKYHGIKVEKENLSIAIEETIKQLCGIDHDGDVENFWRNQRQYHTAMVARIEANHLSYESKE